MPLGTTYRVVIEINWLMGTMADQSTENTSVENIVERRTGVSDFVTLHHGKLSDELVAVGALLACLVLFKFHAISQINNAYFGGYERDAGLYIWLAKSNIRDFFELPWFDTKFLYPYGKTLAWSDNFLVPSFFILILLKAGLSFVASYNLTLLIAIFLNGFFTYKLLFSLTGSSISSIIGGAAFLCSSYLGGHIGHPQTQFAFFLPLTALLFFRYLATPKIFWPVILGLTIFFAFITTTYYAVLSSALVLFLLLGLIILRPRQLSIKAIGTFGIGVLLGLLPIGPFLKPYFAVMHVFGERHLYEAFAFSANSLSLLSASPFNLVYSSTYRFSHSEANLFVGFTILALVGLVCRRLCEAKALFKPFVLFLVFLGSALLSSAIKFQGQYLVCGLSFWAATIFLFIVIYRLGAVERKLGFEILTNRALTAMFLLCGFLFLALSFGPLGDPIQKEVPIGLYSLFYKFYPGFNSIRAVGRLGIVYQFSAIVLASLSIFHFIGTQKWPIWLPWGLLFLILIENFNNVYPLEGEIKASSVFQYLAHLPDQEDAVLVLPLAPDLDSKGSVSSWGDFARLNVNYMNWVFPTGKLLVNGYTGIRNKILREYPFKTSGFPDKRSINAISSIAGLRYIIFVSKFALDFDVNSFTNKMKVAGSDLQFILSDDDGNYLFEYVGQRVADDGFSFIAPPHPTHNALLLMEIMGPFSLKPEQFSADLMALEGHEKRVVSSVEVTTNGQWESFSVPLPPTTEQIRPIQFSFNIRRTSNGKGPTPTLVVRKVRFRLEENTRNPSQE